MFFLCIIGFIVSCCLMFTGSVGIGAIGTFIFVAIYIFMCIIDSGKEEERDKKYESEQSYKREKYKDDVCIQICEYGTPDKRISIEDNDINKDIAIFSEIKQVYILGKFYPFADIINCSVDDEAITIKGKVEMTSVTTSNTASTIGRAVLGGLVAGPAGAIIGGSTSSKSTHTNVRQGNDTIIHKYYINIGINNYATPNIRFFVGGERSLNKVNEIVAVFNIIINNK